MKSQKNFTVSTIKSSLSRRIISKPYKLLYAVIMSLLITGCQSIAGEKDIYHILKVHLSDSTIIKRDAATWFDSSRNRPVPVALHSARREPKQGASQVKQPLVILNPGYPGKSTGYSYIARKLAALGYYVVTVQHNLPTDEPIPTGGNIYQLRLPFWNTGVMNILFVIDRLKTLRPDLDYKHLVLIGHSNGGDMAMLLARQHPGLASTIISLDNRRVPLPLNKHTRAFSIRSSDQVADPGVLPSASDTQKYPITIVKVNTTHNDMGGLGTTQQLDELNRYIVTFLSSTAK